MDQEQGGGAAVSRRGLLKGAAAAAGAMGLPLLATRGAEAAELDLVSALTGRFKQESGRVSGSYHTAFKAVRDEFVRNFAERGELRDVGVDVLVVALQAPGELVDRQRSFFFQCLQ